MMIVKNVEYSNKKELRLIQNLYLEAFPEDERAPFSFLIRRGKRGVSDLLSLIENDLWCGMAYIIHYADIVYILYFAIDPSIRGQGFGQKAIRAIIKKYEGRRIILSIEDWKETSANIEQRISRHNFYLKCGFTDLSCRIIENRVSYAVMAINGNIRPDEYNALINSYLGFFWKHFIKMRLISGNE